MSSPSSRPPAGADRTRLPNLILGGAQKSGTTAVHRLLASHPRVFAPAKPQEVHFFDVEANYRRGVEWYRELFREQGEAEIVFQTSPLYLYEQAVPGRIAQLLPETRFLFILRHPVDRAYSHYWHAVRYGEERLGFPEALEAEPERLRGGFRARRAFSYLDRGRYATQLRRYLDLFPRESVAVLLHDELAADPAATAARIAQFLELPAAPEWPPSRRRGSRVNPARMPRWPALQRLALRPRRRFPRFGYLVDRINLTDRRYPALDPELRRRLADGFRSEIEDLEGLFDLDLSAWKENP